MTCRPQKAQFLNHTRLNTKSYRQRNNLSFSSFASKGRNVAEKSSINQECRWNAFIAKLLTYFF